MTKSGHILAAAAAAGILLLSHCNAFAQNAPPPFPVAPPPNAPLPFVSPIFGDDMVLQRGKANTIWGWSEPGDNVRVQIGERSASGIAGADHRWEVKIQPPAPGGPYTMTISVSNRRAAQCAGGRCLAVRRPVQYGVAAARSREWREEVKAANYPDIRFFTVAGHPAYHHTDLSKEPGSGVAAKPPTGSRRSRTTSRARSSRRHTFPSAWLWMPSAERPPKPGPAPRLFAPSRTSMFLWPNCSAWPTPARPNTATTSCTGTTSTTLGSRRTGLPRIWTIRAGSPSISRAASPNWASRTRPQWPGSARRSPFPIQSRRDAR